jgi:hypothetical protein
MTTTQTLGTVNELATKTVESMASLGELNVRIFEKMSARQMETMSLFMEHATRMMKLATESKGYNEFFKGQVEATKELSERVLAEGKTNMQAVTDVRDDYRNWFEKNMADVSADLRKTTSAA